MIHVTKLYETRRNLPRTNWTQKSEIEFCIAYDFQSRLSYQKMLFLVWTAAVWNFKVTKRTNKIAANIQRRRASGFISQSCWRANVFQLRLLIGSTSTLTLAAIDRNNSCSVHVTCSSVFVCELFLKKIASNLWRERRPTFHG